MTASAPSHSSEDNNVNSLSLRQALDYCLDILKIKDDSECYRNVTQTKTPLAIIKTHGNWITALKLIANCSGIVNYNNSNNDMACRRRLYISILPYNLNLDLYAIC
jgi:hypothetical protein